MPGSGFADSMPAGGPAANRSREWMPRVDAASGHCGSTGSLPAVERSPVGLCVWPDRDAPRPFRSFRPFRPFRPFRSFRFSRSSRFFRSSRSFRFSRPSHSFPLLPALPVFPILPILPLLPPFPLLPAPPRSSPLFRRPDVLMKYRRVRDSVKKSYLCIR